MEYRIIIKDITKQPGDNGFHCVGKIDRYTFTAGLNLPGWDSAGWRVGTINNRAGWEMAHKDLPNFIKMANAIKAYLNLNHWRKGGTEMGKTTVDVALMIQAADDLNKALRLKPPIDIQLKKDALEKEVRDSAVLIDATDVHDCKKKTLDTLHIMGCMPDAVKDIVAEILRPENKPEETEPEKEESTVSAKKTTAKKKVTAKKKTTAKKQVTKKDPPKSAGKKGTEKKEGTKGTSNKQLVYGLWKNGKGLKDPEKIAVKIKNTVKTTTIKGWLNAWANGKNLPAGV